MEKGRSVATKRRLETDKCLRCSLWMFSGIAISLMVILLGFTIWTLVSYQNTVTALQSRVDKLEVDLDLIRSGKEALIAKTVEEEVSKVKFPIMTYLDFKFHSEIVEKKRDFVWSVYKISDKSLGSRRIDWDIPNNWWQYITLIVSTRDHLTRVICGPVCYSLIYVSRETWKNASKLPSFFPLPRNSQVILVL